MVPPKPPGGRGAPQQQRKDESSSVVPHQDHRGIDNIVTGEEDYQRTSKRRALDFTASVVKTLTVRSRKAARSKLQSSISGAAGASGPSRTPAAAACPDAEVAREFS